MKPSQVVLRCGNNAFNTWLAGESDCCLVTWALLSQFYQRASCALKQVAGFVGSGELGTIHRYATGSMQCDEAVRDVGVAGEE